MVQNFLHGSILVVLTSFQQCILAHAYGGVNRILISSFVPMKERENHLGAAVDTWRLSVWHIVRSIVYFFFLKKRKKPGFRPLMYVIPKQNHTCSTAHLKKIVFKRASPLLYGRLHVCHVTRIRILKSFSFIVETLCIWHLFHTCPIPLAYSFLVACIYWETSLTLPHVRILVVLSSSHSSIRRGS